MAPPKRHFLEKRYQPCFFFSNKKTQSEFPLSPLGSKICIGAIFPGLQTLTRGLGLGFGFLMVLLGCVLWRTNFLEKKRRIKLKMQSTSSKRM